MDSGSQPAVSLHHHHCYLLPSPSRKATRIAPDHSKPNKSPARTHVVWAMRDLSLTLRRLSANLTIVNRYTFQDPRPPFPNKPRAKSMATKNEQFQESIATTAKEKEKEEEKPEKEESSEELPPPPEKPDPGDCCGSGCVRCVWDVYYEELEAYNKLYKSNSVSGNSKSKSS